MYKNLRCRFYWLQMISVTHSHLKSCEFFRKCDLSQKQLNAVFFLSEILEFCVIDILCQQKNEKQEIGIVNLASDKSKKLASDTSTVKRTSPVIATSSSAIGSLLLNIAVPPWQTMVHQLRKFFCSRTRFTENKLVTTTKWHSPSSGKVRRNNKTKLVCPRQYIGELQIGWYLFVQPIIYGYITQEYRTTRLSLSSLILFKKLPGALAAQETIFDDVSELISTPFKRKAAESFRKLQARASRASKAARMS